MTRLPRMMAMLASAVVALIGAALAVAVPAHAEDTMQTSCETRQRNNRHHLNVWAFVSDDGANRQWHRFEYELGGQSGDTSNVNFWISHIVQEPYLHRETVYWNHSPDHLRTGVLYTVTPPWPVYTTTRWSESADFKAIFDVFLFDPSCDAAIGI